jgi:hypothetical protein
VFKPPPADWPFFERVQLAVVRALVGEVTPELRAVTVGLTGRHVTVQLIHQGVASDSFAEAMDLVDTYIRADFPAEGADAITLETRLVRCDAPERPVVLGVPLFARHDVRFADPAGAPPPPA